MNEIIQELSPFIKKFTPAISQMLKQNFGIDLVAFSSSWMSKVFIAVYFLCLVYLIIQLLRKKCSFDCSITELGRLDLYFFWAVCFPLWFFNIMNQLNAFSLSAKFICGIIVFALTLWIGHEPLKFFSDTIRRYGFPGMLYSFALLGVGLIGILLILVQYIAVTLPGLILICLGVGLAVFFDDSHYRSEDDEDDW